MVMVEVFKTDVQDPEYATRLLDQIHQTFEDYTATFDLEDCDKILRVECPAGVVEACGLIDLLQGFGFLAEVLPDDPPPDDSTWMGTLADNNPDWKL
jgi:hypothetical protein